MKYKLIENHDPNGKVRSYEIAYKCLWWWEPTGVVGFLNKKIAEDALARLRT